MLTKSLPLNFSDGMSWAWEMNGSQFERSQANNNNNGAALSPPNRGRGDDDARGRFFVSFFGSESEEMKTKPFPFSSTGNNNIPAKRE